MKTLITLTAVLFITGCADALMAVSDDPCRGIEGCRIVSKHGNAGEIRFVLADGRVIETWAPMAVTGAP